MKIKYAGPKVIFTKQGVDFNNNKDDKYIYINIAIQLYKAFEHDYKDNEVYVYDSSLKRLSDSDMMEFIKNRFLDYDYLVKKAKENANGYFDYEIQKVENQKHTLDSIEYDTWIKNIKLMEDYVIQRHFNKNMYYSLVNGVSNLIKKNSIKQIHLPMFQNFVHILHSIQGSLKQTPYPKNSKVDIYKKGDDLIARMDIE